MLFSSLTIHLWANKPFSFLIYRICTRAHFTLNSLNFFIVFGIFLCGYCLERFAFASNGQKMISVDCWMVKWVLKWQEKPVKSFWPQAMFWSQWKKIRTPFSLIFIHVYAVSPTYSHSHKSEVTRKMNANGNESEMRNIIKYPRDICKSWADGKKNPIFYGLK